MSLLIQNATILNAASPFHGQTKDLCILDDGHISFHSAPADAEIIDAKGAYLSLGWCDMQAYFCDPGYEHKEDLSSGTTVAAAGGFTDVLVQPNTQPVLQFKNGIKYLMEGNASRLVQLHAQAAVTLDTKGTELTEMYDLHAAGAKAFGDGYQPLWHPDILLKSLQYLQPLGAVLITRPEDVNLAMYGQMHEGAMSTLLGMKGIPVLSEELIVVRDLHILRYAGGSLHFAGISSAASLPHIRQAKEEGLKVTCDVAIHSLIWTDKDLESYDTNFKVQPPLRTEVDRQALLSGLKDGTIDAIASAHRPQDTESKFLEFDMADFGMISLQTFWPALNSLKAELPIASMIEKITSAPRRILGLHQPELIEGAKANLTLFHPEQSWLFDANSNLSKAQNSPWLGQTLKGKVLATIRDTHIAYHA